MSNVNVFCWSLDWLNGVSTSLKIRQSDYFDFGFDTPIKTAPFGFYNMALLRNNYSVVL